MTLDEFKEMVDAKINNALHRWDEIPKPLKKGFNKANLKHMAFVKKLEFLLNEGMILTTQHKDWIFKPQLETKDQAIIHYILTRKTMPYGFEKLIEAWRKTNSLHDWTTFNKNKFLEAVGARQEYILP